MSKTYSAKKLYPSSEGMCAEFDTEKEALEFYEHSQEEGVKAHVEGKKVIFQLGVKKDD